MPYEQNPSNVPKYVHVGRMHGAGDKYSIAGGSAGAATGYSAARGVSAISKYLGGGKLSRAATAATALAGGLGGTIGGRMYGKNKYIENQRNMAKQASFMKRLAIRLHNAHS